MSMTLETHITIKAPIEKVWAALTKPELVKHTSVRLRKIESAVNP